MQGVGSMKGAGVAHEGVVSAARIMSSESGAELTEINAGSAAVRRVAPDDPRGASRRHPIDEDAQACRYSLRNTSQIQPRAALCRPLPLEASAPSSIRAEGPLRRQHRDAE